MTQELDRGAPKSVHAGPRSLLPPQGLRLLIIVLLIIGVFFRFLNLDRKIYWVDETYTSLRIAGYTESELIREVSSAPFVDLASLQKYQHVVPQRHFIDTTASLAAETPEHPPLYYVLARFWADRFGDSIAATRALPALISLLVFPSLYWLCLELFETRLVGWVALALTAASPFHLLYAREAREYSLWLVTILLSSAALLRAMRLEAKFREDYKRLRARDRIATWAIYGAIVAVGLYSHPYIAFVAIGHGIYVLAIERRPSRTVMSFAIASGTALVAFAPWAAVIATSLPQISRSVGWQSGSRPPLSFLVKNWLGNLSRLFVDFGFNAESSAIYLVPFSIIIAIVLILAVYSLYFVCRRTPQRVWLFIATLLAVTTLALVLPDLISGGRRSTFGRYLMPSYVAIQLAVAYLFATQISAYAPTKRSRAWRVGLLTLLSIGMVSCGIITQSSMWWNKYGSNQNWEVARILNQASNPLVICDPTPSAANFPNIGNLLSLSYIVEPKVKLELITFPNLPQHADEFKDVFLFLATDGLRSRLQTQPNYRIEPAYAYQNEVSLWRLVKR